jgi:hypothetical protein
VATSPGPSEGDKVLSRLGAGHVAAPGRSQPGGRGKHTGRSITRTMQRRERLPVEHCWQRRAFCGWRLSAKLRKPGIGPPRNGRVARTHGVGSTARVDSAAVKVGKVSRVASACPHSDGAAYKPAMMVKSLRACETGGWGRSKRGGLETTQLRPEPRTPGVERLDLSNSGLRLSRPVLDAEPGAWGGDRRGRRAG